MHAYTAHRGFVALTLAALRLAAFAGFAPQWVSAAAYPCTEAGLNSAIAAGGGATSTCATATTVSITGTKVPTQEHRARWRRPAHDQWQLMGVAFSLMLTGFSPPTGPASGGTSVMITGFAYVDRGNIAPQPTLHPLAGSDSGGTGGMIAPAPTPDPHAAPGGITPNVAAPTPVSQPTRH